MIKKFIGDRYRSYTPDGKFWLTVGALVLIVDMAIAYCAGYTVTVWHGLGFAGCALAFAFLPDAAYEEIEHKRYASGILMAVLCLPIGLQAYQQQLTYSAGMRTGDMQQTRVQNTRHDTAQGQVTSERENLALLRTAHAAKAKEYEDLKAAMPWVVTIDASGLKGELKLKEDQLAREERAGREGRKAGCGKVCEGLKVDVADVTKRIGSAERFSALGNEMTRMKTDIDRIQAAIDKKVDVAGQTEFRSSVVANVAAINSQLVKLIRGASAQEAYQVDDVALNYANVASAGLGSLALLILAPVSFFLAGRRRIVGGMPPAGRTGVLDRPAGNTASTGLAFSMPAQQQVTNTRVLYTDSLHQNLQWLLHIIEI
jgi:hypothetical protein